MFVPILDGFVYFVKELLFFDEVFFVMGFIAKALNFFIDGAQLLRNVGPKLQGFVAQLVIADLTELLANMVDLFHNGCKTLHIPLVLCATENLG